VHNKEALRHVRVPKNVHRFLSITQTVCRGTLVCRERFKVCREKPEIRYFVSVILVGRGTLRSLT